MSNGTEKGADDGLQIVPNGNALVGKNKMLLSIL